jgi:hypothetical protein
VEEGVGACWDALRSGWNDERINRWAGAMKRPGDLPKSKLVAYLDDEIEVVDQGGERHSGRALPVPEPTPPKPVDPAEDLAAARAKVRELSRSRRYRTTPLRATGGPGDRFLRLIADGTYLRVNESGSIVMESLDGGTLADAAAELTDRYGIGEERAEEDAIAALRQLQRQGVIVAAEGSGEIPVEVGTSDLPGSEPSG